jgi:glycosyltransferase involved in cell wall biosynthesis
LNPDDLTVVMLTHNEAPNVGRSLDKLSWVSRAVVVDSFSTDETETLARTFPNVTFHQRAFDQHAAQWNYGLDQVTTEWALAVDADYIATGELADELRGLKPDSSVDAYFARFHYCVGGRRLRGNLYPPRAVLFRRSRCRYVQDGHTQRLQIPGATAFLAGYFLHDDRKPLHRWLESQRRYAVLEADKLASHNGQSLSLPDRMRSLIWPAAPAALLYALLVKRCLLDGWPGWLYALQRMYAEVLLSLELLDRRLHTITDEPS